MISTFEEDRKFPTSVTPDSFIKDTNDATDLNSAPHGQFQEKNYDYWIEFFLFKIFFRRKILMIDTAYYVRGHKCTQKMQTLSTKKSKVCKKLTSVCVLRVSSGKKFTDELNVLSWNITTENKYQRISIESEENWCESNLEELMSVKQLHSDEAYVFSNRILFCKCTAFTLSLERRNRNFSHVNMSSKFEIHSTFPDC